MPAPKVSAREALSIYNKIKAGQATVAGEARRLGCFHATLRKALRKAVGSKEYDGAVPCRHQRKAWLAKPKKRTRSRKAAAVSSAPKVEARRKGELACGCVAPIASETDGYGHVRLRCSACGRVESVTSRPAQDPSLGPTFRQRLDGLTASELTAIIERIRRGSSLGAESRKLGNSEPYLLRIHLRDTIGLGHYRLLMAASKRATQ